MKYGSLGYVLVTEWNTLRYLDSYDLILYVKNVYHTYNYFRSKDEENKNNETVKTNA